MPDKNQPNIYEFMANAPRDVPTGFQAANADLVRHALISINNASGPFFAMPHDVWVAVPAADWNANQPRPANVTPVFIVDDIQVVAGPVTNVGCWALWEFTRKDRQATAPVDGEWYMLADKVRHLKTDETNSIEDAFRDAGFAFTQAYRINPACIHLLVVDPSFAGKFRSEERMVRAEEVLNKLPEDTQRDIIVIDTLTTEEFRQALRRTGSWNIQLAAERFFQPAEFYPLSDPGKALVPDKAFTELPPPAPVSRPRTAHDIVAETAKKLTEEQRLSYPLEWQAALAGADIVRIPPTGFLGNRPNNWGDGRGGSHGYPVGVEAISLDPPATLTPDVLKGHTASLMNATGIPTHPPEPRRNVFARLRAWLRAKRGK